MNAKRCLICDRIITDKAQVICCNEHEFEEIEVDEEGEEIEHIRENQCDNE